MKSCVCSEAGWCERHKVRKSLTWWKLCQKRQDYFAAWERGVGPGQNLGGEKRPQKRGCLGLGDRVKQALTLVGITEERVSKWLGRPCGCAEKREMLNRLGDWAVNVLSGRHSEPDKDLTAIIGDEEQH